MGGLQEAEGVAEKVAIDGRALREGEPLALGLGDAEDVAEGLIKGRSADADSLAVVEGDSDRDCE